jgi:predicted O-methyltransferase YrrM
LVVDRSDANPYHTEDWRHVNANAMQEFNDYVASEKRVEVVMLPLFDGLGLIRLKDGGDTKISPQSTAVER